MRPRLTRLLTCAMPTRRRAMRRFVAFCARVSPRPRGLRGGMITATRSRVNARQPRAWSNRLPAGQGEGVASASRLSWVLPASVALKNRMVRTALTNTTFFTVGHFVLPL
jgi:hypothetical protein